MVGAGDELPAPFAHKGNVFETCGKHWWAFHPTRAEESKPYTVATFKHGGACHGSR